MIAIVWVLSFTISCPLLFGLNNTGESCLFLGLRWHQVPGIGEGPMNVHSPFQTEAKLDLQGPAQLRVVPGWARETTIA
jgi:hypothetical protein